MTTTQLQVEQDSPQSEVISPEWVPVYLHALDRSRFPRLYGLEDVLRTSFLGK